MIRYNLASLYFKMQEYKEAARIFEENYEQTDDTLSGVGLIRCLLVPRTDLYDEKQALQIWESLPAFSGRTL